MDRLAFRSTATWLALALLPPALSAAAPQGGGSPTAITETFDDQALVDLARTGAAWGAGVLRAGYGGGSGRLGDLRVPAGVTVVLRTDNEDFAGIADPAIFNPAGILSGAASVQGGFFEFASITVEAGGTLRIEGPNAARLHARGRLIVDGVIDVSGAAAPNHDDGDPLGGLPGAGGPGAAAGGFGADQPDGSAFAGVPGGGFVNPNAVIDGLPGGGIAEPSLLGPSAFVGGGQGGFAHPLSMPTGPSDIAGVVFDIVQICQTKMIGGSAGGGGYRFAGKGGEAGPFPGAGFLAPEPTDGAGGAGVAITPAVRALLPARGLLRGGSGGGGGGAHLVTTQTNGQIFSDCTVSVFGGPAEISLYVPHSAAGGGGGGGAIEVVAGNEARLAGRIDASGGDGGGKTVTGLSVSGGGGSGGAIRLLARKLEPGLAPAALDVSGGAGGFGAGASLGGDGSPGLVHIETAREPRDAAALGLGLAPDAQVLQDEWQATVEDVLSTGTWEPEGSGLAALSGAQSCWRGIPGATGFLAFEADQPGVPGWDMTVNLAGLGAVSWRTPGVVDPSLSVEQILGNELYNAPLLVRFQGARSAGPVADPCDLTLGGPAAGIVPGSLTPWVAHPAELNAFTADPALQPDLFRYVVLFDAGNGFAGFVASVEDLTVLATSM